MAIATPTPIPALAPVDSPVCAVLGEVVVEGVLVVKLEACAVTNEAGAEVTLVLKVEAVVNGPSVAEIVMPDELSQHAVLLKPQQNECTSAPPGQRVTSALSKASCKTESKSQSCF
jgi:hypothetical protein